MASKKGPAILILFLVTVLVFIGGIRYGQHVEKENKKIDFILALTPSPGPTKTSRLSNISFARYENKTCGLEFLYPSSLTLGKSSSEEARFSNEDKVVLTVSCKSTITRPSTTQKVATSEVEFQQRLIDIEQYKQAGTSYVFLQSRNPNNGKTANFILEKSLFLLLERSLRFN